MRLAIFAVTLLFASSVVAQDYLYSHKVPIAAHKKKVSAHTFGKLSKKNVAVFFQPFGDGVYSELDQQALLYDAPPACLHVLKKKGDIVFEEVFEHSDGTDNFDVVIHHIDRSSGSKPGYAGVVVPWDPMYDMQAGHTSADAKMQDLIRALNPRCLPARFRFVYADNQRFQEIRYGDMIWKRNTSVPKQTKNK